MPNTLPTQEQETPPIADMSVPAAAETPQPAPEAPAADASAPPPADSKSAPPSDKPAEPPKTVIDVVREVTRRDPNKPAPQAKAPATGQKQPTPTPQQAAEDDDTKPPPFNQHPRWRKMESKLADASRRIQEYEPVVREHQQLLTFMEQNQLGHEDVTRLLAIGALIRRNPDAALVEVERVLNELRAITGQELPDDLHNEVEEGRISEQRALELSRARAAEQRTRQQLEGEQTRQQAERAQAAQEEVRATAERWEQAKLQQDPAYAQVRPLVIRALQAIAVEAQRQGRPIVSAQQANAALEQAYAEVITAARPPITPPLTTAVPSGGAPPNSVEATTNRILSLIQKNRR